MLDTPETAPSSDRQAYVPTSMVPTTPHHVFCTKLFQNYNFYIINDGIDKQTSLLRPLNKSHRRRISSASVSSIQEGRLRRRSSASQQTVPQRAEPWSSGQSEDTANDMDIDGLAQSMSALRFVPASVMRNQGKVSQKKA